jgi:hypothetical protein
VYSHGKYQLLTISGEERHDYSSARSLKSRQRSWKKAYRRNSGRRSKEVSRRRAAAAKVARCRVLHAVVGDNKDARYQSSGRDRGGSNCGRRILEEVGKWLLDVGVLDSSWQHSEDPSSISRRQWQWQLAVAVGRPGCSFLFPVVSAAPATCVSATASARLGARWTRSAPLCPNQPLRFRADKRASYLSARLAVTVAGLCARRKMSEPSTPCNVMQWLFLCPHQELIISRSKVPLRVPASEPAVPLTAMQSALTLPSAEKI